MSVPISVISALKTMVIVQATPKQRRCWPRLRRKQNRRRGLTSYNSRFTFAIANNEALLRKAAVIFKYITNNKRIKQNMTRSDILFKFMELKEKANELDKDTLSELQSIRDKMWCDMIDLDNLLTTTDKDLYGFKSIKLFRDHLASNFNEPNYFKNNDERRKI
jgi:hypothetical protein